MKPTLLPYWLVTLVPAALLAGAYGFQHLGGLAPCEMCLWQRTPHWLALGGGLSALAFAVVNPALARMLGIAAALALLVTAGIGAFHAGVEYGWWQGPTACSAPPPAADLDSFLSGLAAQPIVRCDDAPWSLLGISMAGYNFLISAAAGGVALWMMIRRQT